MSISELAKSYPEVQALVEQLKQYEKNACFPAGHFYSPIASVDELKEREDEIWNDPGKNGIPGIDLNEAAQIELVRQLETFYNEMPFGKDIEGIRYSFENDFYSYSDAVILYSIIRHFNPKRVVEIGSGHSSAVIVDTKEYFKMDTELICIEPFPDRLFSVLKTRDKETCRIMVNKVQDLNPGFFGELQKNDILLIDSSHVAKTGSDLNYLLFQVIPLLKKGVLIHFHDIIYPFEYPKKWVFQGRNWNENYFIRAFLLYNEAFKIRLFTNYLNKHHPSVFANMPLCYRRKGGSLWLEKQIDPAHLSNGAAPN